MIPHPEDQFRMDTIKAYQAIYVKWREARRQRDLERYQTISEKAREVRRDFKKAWKNNVKERDEIILSWTPGATEPWDPYAWSKFNWRKRPPFQTSQKTPQAASTQDKEETARALLSLSDMWQTTISTKKRARKPQQGESSSKKQ